MLQVREIERNSADKISAMQSRLDRIDCQEDGQIQSPSVSEEDFSRQMLKADRRMSEIDNRLIEIHKQMPNRIKRHASILLQTWHQACGQSLTKLVSDTQSGHPIGHQTGNQLDNQTGNPLGCSTESGIPRKKMRCDLAPTHPDFGKTEEELIDNHGVYVSSAPFYAP